MDFSLSLTPHPRHSNLASPLLYSLGLCTLSSNELVAQHSQSSKRLRELKNSLLLVIQLLRFFNGNVLAVVEKKEFPLVVLDPYVKDSRCQIQAIFVHFALSWLWKEEGRCTWDTGELLMWESELEKVDDVLSLPQAKRSLEILGLLEDVLLHTTIDHLLPTHERNSLSSHMQRTLLLYYLLSCQRENTNSLSPLSQEVTSKVLGRKKIASLLLFSATEHTKKVMYLFHKTQDIRFLEPSSYFHSFMVLRNYCVQNSVPIRVFIERDNLYTVRLKAKPKQHLVCSQQDVQNILQQQQPPTLEIDETDLLPGPVLFVCGVSYSEGNKEENEWLKKLQNTSIDHIFFSYAAAHHSGDLDSELKKLEGDFISGCSLESSSLFLIQHVFLSMDSLVGPSWRRVC